MHRTTVLLALVLASAIACNADPSEQHDPAAANAESPTSLIEQALLTDLLGEAIEIDGATTSADGLLVRLAFEPLIRQTGPVQLQLVQSTGYRLLGVAEGAPLWQLGLREGDVLMSVDGKPIIGREHELRSDWERRPSRVEIAYQRDGQARLLSLRIHPGSAWRSTEAAGSGSVARSDIRDPFGPAGRPTSFGPAPDLVDPFGPASTEATLESELSEGIRCTPADMPDSLGRCEIERATIERLADNPAALAKQARIVPSMQDGVTRGLKLYGIRRASVAAQLGLLNGDMLVAFDGQPLASLESVLAAFTQLPTLGSFTLTLERRGATKQLTIAIVDALN